MSSELTPAQQMIESLDENDFGIEVKARAGQGLQDLKQDEEALPARFVQLIIGTVGVVARDDHTARTRLALTGAMWSDLEPETQAKITGVLAKLPPQITYGNNTMRTIGIIKSWASLTGRIQAIQKKLNNSGM